MKAKAALNYLTNHLSHVILFSEVTVTFQQFSIAAPKGGRCVDTSVSTVPPVANAAT